MRSRIIAATGLFLPLIMACATAPPEAAEATSTAEQAIGNGSLTSYPVVQVVLVSGNTCSGTMLTDSWLITSLAGCQANGSDMPVQVNDVHPSPTPTRTSAVATTVQSGGAALVNLTSPIPFGSYPVISASPFLPGLGYPMYCTGTGFASGLPAQALYFEDGSGNYVPSNGANAEPSDVGGGCYYESNVLSGLETK